MITILFDNRRQFNKSIDVVFNVNTRLNSAGSINTTYGKMRYEFWDENHGQRAAKRLKENGITNFTATTWVSLRSDPGHNIADGMPICDCE